MNKQMDRVVLLVTGVLLLALLALVMTAEGDTPPRAAAVRDGPAFFVPSAAAGGGYLLAPRGWRVTGYLQGGGYALGLPLVDASGCCCLGHLPCAARNSGP